MKRKKQCYIKENLKRGVWSPETFLTINLNSIQDVRDISASNPKIFCFKDSLTDEEYYFYLRFGRWSLRHEGKYQEEVIASGTIKNDVSVNACSWKRAKELMLDEGIIFNIGGKNYEISE